MGMNRRVWAFRAKNMTPRTSFERYVPEVARKASAELEEVDEEVAAHVGEKPSEEPDLKERVRRHLAEAGVIL